MSHRRTPVTPTSAFNLPRQNEWLTDLGVPPVPGGVRVRVRVGVKVRVRLGGRARQLGKLELMPSQPGLLRTNTGITVWGEQDHTEAGRKALQSHEDCPEDCED